MLDAVYFNSFEDVVSWLFSSVPYFLILVFVTDCIFSIMDTIIHLGGRH